MNDPAHCSGGSPRFAYVLYATDEHYAVAALVAAKSLRRHGARQDVDFVLLHLPLPSYVLATAHDMGIVTREVEPLPHRLFNPYFRHCLVKLRVFQLTDYDRVVFLDADTLPLASLGELFTLPLAGTIAAPRAYWLPQPCVTSLLLVVEPSLSSWERLERHFSTAYEQRVYDMDIVNREFGSTARVLPEPYACLDAEWEDKIRDFRFADPAATLEKVKIIHFSALAKPWFFTPSRVRRLRPNAYRTFYDFWEQWWVARDQIIAEASPAARRRLILLRWRGRRILNWRMPRWT